MFTQQDENEWRGDKVTLPARKYSGAIASAKFVLTKKNTKKLCVDYAIIAPKEYAGAVYTHWMRLDSKTQKYYTRLDLIKLGVNVEVEISELADEVGRVVGSPVYFELKESVSGGFQNCEILKSEIPVEDESGISF